MPRKARNRSARSTSRKARQTVASVAEASRTPATFTTVGLSQCGWCGRPLRALPFQMDAVVLCVDCYGSHHYEDRPGEAVPATHGEESGPDAAASETGEAAGAAE